MITKSRTIVSTPAGFAEAQQRVARPRMIVSVRGEERAGKTQFGLTAPAPIAVFPFDNNTEELVQKWLMAKKIFMPKEPLYFMDATDQEHWLPVWERFKELFLAAVTSPLVRTVMVDTFTEAHELCRLVRFGKLSEVPAHFYGKVNAEFKRLIDSTYQTDKNVVLVHRVKDEYVKNVRTGERVLAGYGEVGYKVQLNILCWRELSRRDAETGAEGFGISLENCTQNETLAGTYLEEPRNNWQELGKLVYPGTTDEDWQ